MGDGDMYGFGGDEDEDDDFGFSDDEDDDDYDGFGFGDEYYDEEESDVEEEKKVESTGNESEKVPMHKFGWFYKRNGTSWSDGDLLMETGPTDVNHLGRIVTWNGNNRTEAY